MGRKLSPRKILEYDEMLRQLVVHYGWKNTLFQLANMSMEKVDFGIPKNQDHWNYIYKLLTETALYYQKKLEPREGQCKATK